MNYLFKQDPGDFNSLGSIRINFPSKDGVYMHDTPLKNLFGEDMRFHSSGCVRVQNVRELVELAAARHAGLVAPGNRRGGQVAASASMRGSPSRCRCTGSMSPPGRRPTAWSQFRDDIYNQDGLGPYATTFKG